VHPRSLAVRRTGLQFVARRWRRRFAARKLAPPPTELKENAMHPSFTPIILAHTFAALAAVALGAAMFLARKGTFMHRVAGRSWVALMLLVAISSFWIKGDGSYSWIHGLSVTVIVLLCLAVWFAISRHIERHRRLMIGIYAGALGVAGMFTLLPYRLLGRLVWGSLGLI
jgi:uncharacterized membrane protein